MTPADERELLATIAGTEGLAAMLHRLRVARGMTEAELGVRIGRPGVFIVRIEAAELRDPTILTATALARACEVSVSLFVASFALPRDDPLPWPRERQPPPSHPYEAIPGPPALGAMLRHLRLKRNWSQREMAVLAGLHPSYLSKIENGRANHPLLLTLTRLGRAFARMTALQLAYSSQLAQSYAGEIPAPPFRRIGRDTLEPRADPD